jgi:hypothetical protein
MELCRNCNEFWKDYNERQNLGPFKVEHYKNKNCYNLQKDKYGNYFTCIKSYVDNLYYALDPYDLWDRPERSKREDSDCDSNQPCVACNKAIASLMGEFKWFCKKAETLNIYQTCMSKVFSKYSEMRCSELHGNMERDK